MVLFIRIEKDSEIKEENLEDIKDLYKKCGLRKPDGFDVIDSKYIKDLDIDLILWGRIIGRANIKSNYTYQYEENKYVTIYGTCAFVAKKNDKLVDLTLDMWNKNESNKNESNKNESNKNESNKNESNKNELEILSNEDDLDSLSDGSYESNDSELQKDEYIYSSEDEI